MKKSYINIILWTLGLNFLVFLFVNFIDPEIYSVEFGRLLAIISIGVSAYCLYISNTDLGKTSKRLLTVFGTMLIGFLALLVYKYPKNILATVAMFIAYGLIWLGVWVSIEIIQRKHIEKINKRLTELNGEDNDK